MESKLGLQSSQEALKKLRDTLREIISKIDSDKKNNEMDFNKAEFKNQLGSLGMQTLVKTTMVKLAHDSIIRGVDESRQKLRDEQEQLMKYQLKLDSLSYEYSMLQSQMALMREKAPGKDLKKVGIEIPNSDVTETNENTHSQVEKLLQEELKRRKVMREEVDVITEKTAQKRRKFNEMSTKLRKLPDTIKELNSVLKPVRGLLDIKGLDGTNEILNKIKKLPRPLYVLGREAISFQHVNKHRISVTIDDENLGNGPEDNQLVDLYEMYPTQVCIEINDPISSDSGEQSTYKLRVKFGYHPRLDVVTISSDVLMNDEVDKSISTKELQFLYPFDCGNTSPNPLCEHLKDGNFQFSVQKCGGRRPYVWANLICNITCLESFEVEDRHTDNDGMEFRSWPQKAASYRNNIRFKTVVGMLEQRLRSILSLRQQLQSLMHKKILISATELGLGVEPNAKLVDFVKLPRQKEEENKALIQQGTHGPYTEVWCMIVEVRTMVIKCMIGIEPEYPLRSPVFRIVCEKMIGDVVERDILHLEQNVNEYTLKDGGTVKNEMLLSGQIIALMVYAEKLSQKCGND